MVVVAGRGRWEGGGKGREVGGGWGRWHDYLTVGDSVCLACAYGRT